MTNDLDTIPKQGYSKRQTRQVDYVWQGLNVESIPLDATTTTDTIKIGDPAGKLSFQTSGTLAVNLSFSINGETYFGTTALAAGIPLSYTTHIIRYVKVDRTGGAGVLSVLAA